MQKHISPAGVGRVPAAGWQPSIRMLMRCDVHTSVVVTRSSSSCMAKDMQISVATACWVHLLTAATYFHGGFSEADTTKAHAPGLLWHQVVLSCRLASALHLQVVDSSSGPGSISGCRFGPILRHTLPAAPVQGALGFSPTRLVHMVSCVARRAFAWKPAEPPAASC